MQEHQSAGFRKGVGWGSCGCLGGKRPRGEDPKFLHRRGKGEVGGLAGGEPGEQLGRRIWMTDGSARRLDRPCMFCRHICTVGFKSFLGSMPRRACNHSAPRNVKKYAACRSRLLLFVVFVIVVACVFVVFVVSCGRPFKWRVTKPAASSSSSPGTYSAPQVPPPCRMVFRDLFSGCGGARPNRQTTHRIQKTNPKTHMYYCFGFDFGFAALEG